MEELKEELDTLKAILMNDVIIDVLNGNVRVDLKLEGFTVTVQFKGEIQTILLRT